MTDQTTITVTRDQLADALTHIEVRPVNGQVVADWLADTIFEVINDD